MLNTLLVRLSKAWRKQERPALRSAATMAVLVLLVAVARTARVGTGAMRLAAAVFLVATVTGLLLVAARAGRKWKDERLVLRRILFPVDRELGARAIRAFNTVEQTTSDEGLGSPALATHHYEKLLRQASLLAVDKAAARRAVRWRWGAIAGAALLFGLIAPEPVKVFEGFNVLCARNGHAPFRLDYIDFKHVSVKPPAYLRAATKTAMLGVSGEYPAGSSVVVKGQPRYEGRELVLTDGSKEVPFVSDGHGGLTANWTLTESATLSVASRHGDVRILEPESLPLEATPDSSPEVWLEGAPQTLALKDLAQVDLRYRANDDHGIRQVDLVISSGKRDSRRVLLRLDGDDRVAHGGYSLRADDDYLKRMFLPVALTIEVKDDDPISGPKWGRSQPIVVLPPTIGEPEALRFGALIGARNKLVSLLASDTEPLPDGLKAKTHELERRQEQRKDALDHLRRVLDGSYAGLAVAEGLKNFLLGQRRVLLRAPRTGAPRERQLEDAVLAIDVALQRLAGREAQAVSVLLADVVEDVAEGARQARDSEARQKGLTRLDHSLRLAQAGARELGKLGLLGNDLGGVALGDLDRVARARNHDDLGHAELAARHLAERLRRPNPSFGSASRGGVESGSAGRNSGHGSPSESDQQFDRLAREIERLAQDHASGLGEVEDALEQAKDGADASQLQKEAELRAEALRQSVAGLPDVGADPGTSRASAALAREHARAMAQNLEQLDLEKAVESGEQALLAIKEARRMASGPTFGDWLDPEALNQAERRLTQDLEWSRTELEKLKTRVNERAKQGLGRASERERELARRAGNLSGRGKNDQSPLPEEILKRLDRAEALMREAARELAEGSAEKGFSLQRDAQHQLEQARTGKTSDPGEPSQSQSKELGGRDLGLGGEVPEPGEDRAKKFRERVLKGLGKEREGRLAPAVRRYAEELLK